MTVFIKGRKHPSDAHNPYTSTQFNFRAGPTPVNGHMRSVRGTGESLMGMDVYGRKPTSLRGRLFSTRYWAWHPLADYCQKVAPEITSACRYWHSNDGDGLDAAGALALAEALQREIEANRTDDYARRYASKVEVVGVDLCDVCARVRKVTRNHDVGDLKEGRITCFKCRGAGYVLRWGSDYSFSTGDVARFVAFLRESGGFVIE